MLNRALSEAGDGAGSAPEWVRVPSCGLAGQPASSLPSTAQPPSKEPGLARMMEGIRTGFLPEAVPSVRNQGTCLFQLGFVCVFCSFAQLKSHQGT